jgi:hypothetical protein
MTESDLIEPSNTNYSSPHVLIAKNFLNFFIDHRNAKSLTTKSDYFPMRRSENYFDRKRKNKY